MNPAMILLILMLTNGGSNLGRTFGSNRALNGNNLLGSSGGIFKAQNADDFLMQLHQTVDTLDRVNSITHSISALKLPTPRPAQLRNASETIEPLRDYSHDYDPYDDIINAEPVEYAPAPTYESTPTPFSLPSNMPDLNQLMQTFGPVLQMLSKQNG